MQIASGAATAVCAFCGNHQLVNPSIPVAHHVGEIGESVGNVDRSTARLAAELALPRLQAERQQCKERFDYFRARQGDPAVPWYILTVFGSVVAGLLLALLFSLIDPRVGVLMFFVGVVAGLSQLGRVRRHFRKVGRKPDPELVAARERLKSLDKRIAENLRIADS